MIRQVVPQQCPGLAALVVAAYQEYALVLRANAWEQNWWFVLPLSSGDFRKRLFL